MRAVDYYVREADKHSEIAEWYRIMADYAVVPILRARYVELAAAYDRLAEAELQLANKNKRSN
jgi:hypothetical protein